MNRKFKSLFSNTAVFGVSNVVSKAILSVLLPLYTRTLTSSEYGTIELITTISGLLYPVISLSIQDSAFRFAMDKNANQKQVLKNCIIIILFSCVVFIPVSFLLQNYKGIGGYYVYFYFFSVFSLIRGVLTLYIKGINKTIVFAFDAVLYNFLLLVGNFLFLVLLRTNIHGYFYAMFLSSAFSIVYLLKQTEFFSVVKEKTNKRLMMDMLAYSSPLILNSISWGLTHVVDKVMLTNMIGSDANGIYSTASKIPSLMSLVATVFTQAWTISLIQDYESEKDVKYYSMVFLLTHITCIFASSGILLFNNNLFAAILGKSFRDSVKYVPTLLIGTLFLTYSSFFAAFFSASKQSKINMYTSVIGCLINIILNVVLIPKYNIFGACIATTSSYVFISISRMYFGQKTYPINIEIDKYVISIILLCICSVMVTIKKNEMIFIFMYMLVCLVLYFSYIKMFASFIINRVKTISLKQYGEK